jgi:succinate dehydrogenase/fumarate reductase flavoprotein subunit
MATLIPKGFGAPGMNGINSMGGRELNALGERFMGKYDPMWENGRRINQITGTYQELIEGKGPPFYIDMRHFDPKEVHHLQYVLMPGDKATYLDYCRQKGVDFGKVPLEVEISELAVSGMAKTDENFETNVSGLYNACLFQASSGALCGGYFAGTQAAKTARLVETFGDIDHGEAAMEKERVSRPMQNTAGIHYKGFAGAIRQVMNYYVGYRRNKLGLEVALDRLAFIEGYTDKITASNFHELMRANESIELLRMCQIVVRACMERKESGRAMFRRTDYPEMNPAQAKPLVVWQENGEPKFSWGV